jgi:acyl-CoA hydrolase
VFPNDTNPQGTAFGGRVLQLVDVVGAIAARRHCRLPVVTAEIDSVDFLSPIRLGDCMQLVAEVSWAGRTSMEVEVRVYVEDLVSGRQHEAATAYLTYVAVDGSGRPHPVPPLAPETEAERRRMAQAEVRRRERLARRSRLSARP